MSFLLRFRFSILFHINICLLSSVNLSANENEFSSLLAEFKKGNYSLVSQRSKLEIEKQNYSPNDERLILLFISSSSDGKEMDEVMEKSYNLSSRRNSVFYNSVYLLMERGLVLGDHQLVEKWGYRFRQNGKSSTRYEDGLYLYASMFYESKRWKDSMFIIHLALQESPSKVLKAKLNRLKDYNQLMLKK